MHAVSCTNTHHDIIDLVNHGMVKNTKNWIPWERNVTFLRNNKILNLCQITHFEKLSFSRRGNLQRLKAVNYFRKKSSTIDVRLSSKYAPGLGSKPNVSWTKPARIAIQRAVQTLEIFYFPFSCKIKPIVQNHFGLSDIITNFIKE